MLYRHLARFVGDKTASMAAQVVVFSVMLFGVSGVALDFGRVYNTHSQMQAFTDQAALAAAHELTGDTDAIQRAIAAVFKDDGTTIYSKFTKVGSSSSDPNSAQFGVSHLYFLRAMSDETGAQYDLGDDLASADMLFVADADNLPAVTEAMEIASTQARYVIAVGEEMTVLNSVMQVLNFTGDENIQSAQRIRTVSAAKHTKVTCGAFTNLVVCNPWENDPNQSFSSALGDPANEGIQFLHVADGVMDANGQMSAPNSLARRLLLEGAAQVDQICDPTNPNMPGYDPSLSADEMATVRAICFLAAATQEEYCVADEIAIVAATPEEITTSLNTVFDIWDEPIAEVLEWDRDADGDHSQLRDVAGNSLFDAASAHAMRDFSDEFQPALNIMKGRTWDESLALQSAASRPLSSRLNYPRTYFTGQYEVIINTCIRPDSGLAGFNCLTDSEGNEFSWIAQPTSWFNVLEYYTANFDAHYQSTFFTTPAEENIATFAKAAREQQLYWHHAPNAFTTFWPPFTFQAGDTLTLTGEDASLAMEVPDPLGVLGGLDQRDMRRCIDNSTYGLLDFDAAYAADVNNAPNADYCQGYFGDTDAGDASSPAAADPATTLARHSVDREPTYPNFTYEIDQIDATQRDERRFLDVTVVNCGQSYVNASGVTMAPVEGFAEVYLLTPPRVTCPNGTETCANDQISHANIYSEFVEITAGDEQHYAVLVR